MNCKNCGNRFEGNFCNNCGQSSAIDRINWKYLLHSVSENVLQLDKGFLYTAKSLLLRPKETLTGFFNGKRKSFSQPFGFLIVSATILLIATTFWGNGTFVDDVVTGFKMSIQEDPEATFDARLFDIVIKNQIYIFLLTVPLFSIASFLSFRKSNYNFSEHLILNLFITGEQLLFYTVFSFISDRDAIIVLLPLGLGFIYLIWVYNQIFNKTNWVIRNLKLLITYIIYFMGLFFASAVLFIAAAIIKNV